MPKININDINNNGHYIHKRFMGFWTQQALKPGALHPGLSRILCVSHLVVGVAPRLRGRSSNELFPFLNFRRKRMRMCTVLLLEGVRVPRCGPDWESESETLELRTKHLSRFSQNLEDTPVDTQVPLACQKPRALRATPAMSPCSCFTVA